MSPKQQRDFTRLILALVYVERAREDSNVRDPYLRLVRDVLESTSIQHWPALQATILDELSSL